MMPIPIFNFKFLIKVDISFRKINFEICLGCDTYDQYGPHEAKFGPALTKWRWWHQVSQSVTKILTFDVKVLDLFFFSPLDCSRGVDRFKHQDRQNRMYDGRVTPI